MEPIYRWESIHSKVFSKFIETLNNTQKKYFVLRNFEGLPESNNSKDVDIIIAPGSYKSVLSLLIECFRSFGLSHYYIMNYERAHCVYGIDVEKSFAIHIDLIEGYANKGYEIFDFEELYSNTLNYKSFKVLNGCYDIVLLLLYKIIGCKELKEKYRTKINDIYKIDRRGINEILQRILGRKCAQLVFEDLDNADFDNIVAHSKDIAKAAKRRAFINKPFKTFVGWWKFYSEKSYNMILCPKSIQKLIAVEAPDGAGKTTFIDYLRIKIAEYFVSDISKSKIYHFRPLFLPNLGAVGEKAGVMKQDTNFTEPHRAKQANRISSFIRMTYYWLDYLIGMPLILRKNAQFDKITIFDRYIYDFLVDPRRSRINLPYWLRRLFTKMVKQPKIVFVLDAPTEVIYKRKQELTPEEITRQLVEFRKLSSLGKRYFRLDASKSPEEIANDAIKVIVENFTKKI